MTTTIQIRPDRDLAANWTSANPILHNGEQGVESDTHKMKIGDGATPWAGLVYVVGQPGATGPQGPTGPASTVPGPQGPTGPTGATGPQGPQGTAGADSTVPGPAGPTGPTGATGSQGPAGTAGATGPPGPGVPAAGTTGQVLAKTSNADYATGWADAAPTTPPDNSVTNAKLADMASPRIKGRATAGSGDPEDLTGTQATALLDLFTATLKGLAPPSAGGTVNFLRADGSWALPAPPVPSEVEISATDPIGTNPVAELWLDTSAGATAVPLPAGMPRGFIGEAKLAADFTITAAGVDTDVTGLAVTWTADPTRRYKTTIKVYIMKLTAVGDIYMFVANPGVNNRLDSAYQVAVPISGFGSSQTYQTFLTETGLSGTQTRQVRVQTASNGCKVNASAGYESKIIVEDIGGTLMPALKARIGGAWVTIPTGADEVFVGPATPTDSATELWYDTSAVTVAAGLYGVGTMALRPTAPSQTGFQYWATDTQRLWMWNGSAWLLIGGKMPRIFLTRSTQQSVPSSAITPATWNVEDADIDGFHDNVTNSDRITFPMAGVYRVDANIVYDYINTTGTRGCWIEFNGGGRYVWAEVVGGGAGTSSIVVSRDFIAAAGDWVRVQLFQSSGSALLTAGAPFFAARYTGPS